MKIALIGYGKMGRMTEEVALQRGHQIVCKIDAGNKDAFDSPAFASADVAIEFTSPSAAYENCIKAFEHNIKVVSGSTGWMKEHGKEMHERCIKDGKTLFWSSNFSVGVAVFAAVNKYLAHIMNAFPQYDVVVEETHHAQKIDAPSGTAVTLADDIVSQLDRKNKWVKGMLISQEGTTGSEYQPAEDEIIVDSIRLDDEKGTHTIAYECQDDGITITHRANTRRGFALGAVLAAEYTASHSGLLTINDLFKF